MRGKGLHILVFFLSGLLTSCGGGENSPASRAEPEVLTLEDGAKVPLFLVSFDKHGQCISPKTRDQLLRAVRDDRPTDVFLLSHGWNNDWAAATSLYHSLIKGYEQVRRENGIAGEYRPLYVGVIWPSTVLVLPWEKGPQLMAPGRGATSGGPAGAANDSQAVRELADELGVAGNDLQAIVDKGPAADRADIARLAEMLSPIYGRVEHEELAFTPGAPSADELIQSWSVSQGMARGRPATAPAAAPEALALPDPRWIVRVTTFLMMKDRSGRVGFNGVAPLLQDLLSAGNAKVHLVGHSYGAKVLMSALCAGSPSRPVRSVLLLQPAMSHLAFAKDAAGAGRDGGYRAALSRTEQPLFVTFSPQDFPLHDLFHLFVRRGADLGEVNIGAAALTTATDPPSRYAALGGYGPRGELRSDWELVPIRPPPNHYEIAERGPRLYGLSAGGVIEGHGKVSNRTTWWAIYELVAGQRASATETGH